MDYKAVRLESVNWVYPTQYRDKWRSLVNMVMQLRVTKCTGGGRGHDYLFKRTLLYGISRAVSQLASQSVSQSVSQPISQLASHSVRQPVSLLV